MSTSNTSFFFFVCSSSHHPYIIPCVVRRLSSSCIQIPKFCSYRDNPHFDFDFSLFFLILSAPYIPFLYRNPTNPQILISHKRSVITIHKNLQTRSRAIPSSWRLHPDSPRLPPRPSFQSLQHRYSPGRSYSE
jgi:hypothetical protein